VYLSSFIDEGYAISTLEPWHFGCSRTTEREGLCAGMRWRAMEWIQEVSVAKEDRGFASMDRVKQREIASKGGKAAHQKGTAHEWTSEEAREAGRKGGMASHRRRKQMMDTPTETTAIEGNANMSDAPESADRDEQIQ
jgi:general stress protein YciG